MISIRGRIDIIDLEREVFLSFLKKVPIIPRDKIKMKKTEEMIERNIMSKEVIPKGEEEEDGIYPIIQRETASMS